MMGMMIHSSAEAIHHTLLAPPSLHPTCLCKSKRLHHLPSSHRLPSSFTHLHLLRATSFPGRRAFGSVSDLHSLSAVSPAFGSFREPEWRFNVKDGTSKQTTIVSIHQSIDLQDQQQGSSQSETAGKRALGKKTRKVKDVSEKPKDAPETRASLQAKMAELLSNAQRFKVGSAQLYPRYSLGIDLGDARTGVAVGKGFAPRPVSVVHLRGEKLETHLLQLADKERANEFILGLPKSSRGTETTQSNKVRCFAGRLAARAAERGWRVYLQDEFGTTEDALDYMIERGSTRRGRRAQLDAYAAVMLLRSYFDSVGRHAELVVPKDIALQQRICEGPITSMYDVDEFGNDDDDIQFLKI